MLIAPSAESAVDDELRERFVAKPLTSLSVSSVGSRLTNSFCSNCTTTYGRALGERTLRPRAWMSLTWIWPLDGPDEGVPFAADTCTKGVAVTEPDERVDGVGEGSADAVDGVDDGLGAGDCFGGGGCCMLKMGA